MRRSVAPPAKRRRPGTGEQLLSEHEQLILDLITGKGSDGVLKRVIKYESQLAETAVNGALETLSAKNLIKEVESIKYTGRKVFMAANFMPSKEVSGSIWYNEGKLDKELVGHLLEFCFKHLKSRKVDTLEGIHKALRDVKLATIEIPLPETAELLTSMVLGDKIIEVKSTGLGIFYGIPVGKTCYKIASASGGGKSLITGAFASIPCGMCPRIAFCTPDGDISPSTCVYFDKWLDVKMKKPEA